MELSVISLALCSLLAIIFIVIRITIGGVYGLLAKIIASFGFVSCAIFSLPGVFENGQLFFCLVIVGLLCGLVGDVLLDLKKIYPKQKSIYLNAGMLSFAIGHIAYAIGFSCIALLSVANLLSPVLWSVGISIVLSPAIMFVSKKMKLKFDNHFWQSLSYCIVLVFMASYSIFLAVLVPEMLLVGIAMPLFIVSDLVLSLMYFGGKEDSKFFIAANHSLYYAAQILILAFVVFF